MAISHTIIRCDQGNYEEHKDLITQLKEFNLADNIQSRNYVCYLYREEEKKKGEEKEEDIPLFDIDQKEMPKRSWYLLGRIVNKFETVDHKKCGLRLLPKKPNLKDYKKLEANKIYLYKDKLNAFKYIFKDDSQEYSIGENELKTENIALIQALFEKELPQNALFADDPLPDVQKQVLQLVLGVTSQRGHPKRKPHLSYSFIHFPHSFALSSQQQALITEAKKEYEMFEKPLADKGMYGKRKEINNLGYGNCAFYAFAIGLLPILQRDIVAHNQKRLVKLKAIITKLNMQWKNFETDIRACTEYDPIKNKKTREILEKLNIILREILAAEKERLL